MLAQCEMLELYLTDKDCSKRTHIISDWCHICRVREAQNVEV